jgi:hypothetical protein
MAWKFRNRLAALPRSRRLRCGAKLRQNEAALERAIRGGGLDLYLKRSYCRNWAVNGSRRCRLHGAFSTGPRTSQGMARTVAAATVGRMKWLARLRAEGKSVPFGRKKGGKNRSKDEREHAEYERHCHRDARDVHRRIRAERKALRRERRRLALQERSELHDDRDYS